MEKKIERIFATAFIIGDKHKKVIGEITKACQSDMAEALQAQGETFREIEDEWVERVRELMAQLAEMRRWIEPIHELCEHYKDKPGLEKEAYAQIYRLAGYALSAAPEVLWSGEAELGHWTSEPNKVRLTAIMTAIGGGNLLGEIGKDGQQVKVFVVRKGDDEKHKA